MFLGFFLSTDLVLSECVLQWFLWLHPRKTRHLSWIRSHITGKFCYEMKKNIKLQHFLDMKIFKFLNTCYIFKFLNKMSFVFVYLIITQTDSSFIHILSVIYRLVAKTISIFQREQIQKCTRSSPQPLPMFCVETYLWVPLTTVVLNSAPKLPWTAVNSRAQEEKSSNRWLSKCIFRYDVPSVQLRCP